MKQSRIVTAERKRPPELGIGPGGGHDLPDAPGDYVRQ
jgi:hypothetical protein